VKRCEKLGFGTAHAILRIFLGYTYRLRLYTITEIMNLFKTNNHLATYLEGPRTGQAPGIKVSCPVPVKWWTPFGNWKL